MTEVNVPLLRKAVEWVEEQAVLPEIDREWRQQSWLTTSAQKAASMVSLGLIGTVNQYRTVAAHCGTAFCVAGYIGQMLDERYRKTTIVDGVHVSNFAEEALGISRFHTDTKNDETYDLFNGSNSAADVRRIAELIAGEKL